MKLSCQNPFSILERHVCSEPPRNPPPPPPPHASGSNLPNGGPASQRLSPLDNSLKRKASGTPTRDDTPKEKRAKTSSPIEVDVDVGSGPSVEPKRAGPQTTSSGTGSASAATATHQADEPIIPATAEKETEDERVQVLKAHKAEVFVCAWNPVDKTLLASGSRDSVVHLWSVPVRDENGKVTSQTGPPRTCAYSPIQESADLTSLDWSKDGALLAIGCYDSVLRICDANGKLYFSHAQHDGPIFAARFSPGGRWLASASLDGSACIWDVQGKRLHRQFSVHDKCCLDVDWLSESEFATSGSDGLVQIMNIDNPKPLRTLVGHTSEVNQLRTNVTRTKLASCSDDKTARIWNIADIVHGRAQDDRVITLAGHKGQVSNLVWSPRTVSGQHELLVTSSFDRSARLWDSETGQCLRVFHDHTKHVYNLAFSPDGRLFASAGGDGWLFVYDAWTRKKRWSYNASKSGIFELSWQQSGLANRIAMALENRSVVIADVTRIYQLQ
ncbi:F-box-like/WD repeat-containing protein TBL1XR1 [Trametes pubescens]|uniref:F-box-like/WD repeat-containing protein TBL1XR1 n=1 Tax=Trametes pubescens TaxID=154538 RepID=A0A1M2W7Z0_TRAPU|nr:F-box-like/WD repeat-containing protein TBL1XR1 [Trametes pubescens]